VNPLKVLEKRVLWGPVRIRSWNSSWKNWPRSDFNVLQTIL